MSLQLDLNRAAEQPTQHPSVTVLESNFPDAAILPIAGGKGGTGKSTLTANIGLGLSLLGYKVILVDGDLGGADLHLFFDQIAPSRTLGQFLAKQVSSLDEVVLPTPNENLKLVCGGNELIGLANLSYLAKEKLIRHIRSLEADYVLIDLGAGSSYNTLDFFTMSNQGIIVCTPEPQARVDAYGFIKNMVYRMLRRLFSQDEVLKRLILGFARHEGSKSARVVELLDMIRNTDIEAGRQAYEALEGTQLRLVLNRVRHRRHIEEAQKFVALVKEYLHIDMSYIGYVRSDEKILDACEKRRPVLIEFPKTPASKDIYSLLMDGLKVKDRLHRFPASSVRKFSQVAKGEARSW